jgi:hypothetical protein
MGDRPLGLMYCIRILKLDWHGIFRIRQLNFPKDLLQVGSSFKYREVAALFSLPSFVLAKTGKELTGNMIEGARPYPFFDFNIKQILNAQTPGASVDVVDLHGRGSQ